MNKLPVFVDSDVIISSLISEKGAAYLLIRQLELTLFISTFSYREITAVTQRLKLDEEKLESLVKNRFEIVKLKTAFDKLKEQYKEYVLDENDAHIIAGATKVKAQFLLSYNLKHYRIDKIKKDFHLLVTTPARFLQFLRST